MSFQPTDVLDVLISREEIEARAKTLGEEISRHYGEEPIIAVGILRGCIFFFTELLKYVTCPLKVDFMVVSSYGDSQESSGNIKIDRDLKESIQGEHVLIVDDIVDTGQTLQSLGRLLETRRPKSLKVCSMLDKPAGRKTEIGVDFVGFTIENHFVVGYGLDYKQYYRNVDFIGRLKDGMQPAFDAHIDSLKASQNS